MIELKESKSVIQEEFDNITKKIEGKKLNNQDLIAKLQQNQDVQNTDLLSSLKFEVALNTDQKIEVLEQIDIEKSDSNSSKIKTQNELNESNSKLGRSSNLSDKNTNNNNSQDKVKEKYKERDPELESPLKEQSKKLVLDPDQNTSKIEIDLVSTDKQQDVPVPPDSEKLSTQKPFSIDTLLEEIGVRWYQIRIYIVLALLGIGEGSQVSIFTIMIPVLENSDWEVTPTQNSLQASLLFITFLIGSLIAGQIADRFFIFLFEFFCFCFITLQ